MQYDLCLLFLQPFIIIVTQFPALACSAPSPLPRLLTLLPFILPTPPPSTYWWMTLLPQCSSLTPFFAFNSCWASLVVIVMVKLRGGYNKLASFWALCLFVTGANVASGVGTLWRMCCALIIILLVGMEAFLLSSDRKKEGEEGRTGKGAGCAVEEKQEKKEGRRRHVWYSTIVWDWTGLLAGCVCAFHAISITIIGYLFFYITLTLFCHSQLTLLTGHLRLPAIRVFIITCLPGPIILCDMCVPCPSTCMQNYSNATIYEYHVPPDTWVTPCLLLAHSSYRHLFWWWAWGKAWRDIISTQGL